MDNPTGNGLSPDLVGVKKEPIFTLPPTPPMRVFVLQRICEHYEFGNQGVLIDYDKKEIVNTTLERIWKNNEPLVSCIPPSDDGYICKRFKSEKHPNTFEITGVPNRVACLFHPGNIALIDSEGCVLLGEKFDPVYIEKEKRWSYGVLESQIGFKQFMDTMNAVGQFRLIVKKAIY